MISTGEWLVLSRSFIRDILWRFQEMASMGVVPTSSLREPAGHSVGVDRLPEEMNDMKIRDDKVQCIF